MITMHNEAPVDRDVTVTVSLTFKESELRLWAAAHCLGVELGARFREAIECDRGNDPYVALRAYSL